MRNRFSLGLVLLAFLASDLPVQAAYGANLSPHIEQVLGAIAADTARPGAFARLLSDEVFETWEIGCVAIRKQDSMECIIDSVQKICRKSRAMGEAECLLWGDLFASLSTHRAFVLEAGDLYHARRMPGRERLEFLKNRYKMRSQGLERVLELGASPCEPYDVSGGRACEAQRIEKFCLSFGTVSRIPFAACVTGILYGKWVKVGSLRGS
ncbi:hypothetical protein WDW86_16315 [Bdellovibrionota bacterium FG-2]